MLTSVDRQLRLLIDAKSTKSQKNSALSLLLKSGYSVLSDNEFLSLFLSLLIDACEKTRELATEVLLSSLEKADKLSIDAVSLISSRLSTKVRHHSDPAEEIRLLSVKCTILLLHKGNDHCTAFLENFVEVAVSGLRDSFPEVKKVLISLHGFIACPRALLFLYLA
jgi:hypothetical protein